MVHPCLINLVTMIKTVSDKVTKWANSEHLAWSIILNFVSSRKHAAINFHPYQQTESLGISVRINVQGLTLIWNFKFILPSWMGGGEGLIFVEMHLSIFFPYITGTDKRYRSQCQKSMIFPNFETKNSQLTCEKKRPMTSKFLSFRNVVWVFTGNQGQAIQSNFFGSI